ncbi:MAG: hypothetical protein AAF514_11325 [Verrucomicrobiota bacterium]
MIASLLLILVLLSAGWLVVNAISMAETLFPGSDRVLIVASPGDELIVGGGGIQTVAGSPIMEVWNPRLRMLMAGPFLLLVLMAVMGCLSIFRRSGVKPTS